MVAPNGLLDLLRSASLRLSGRGYNDFLITGLVVTVITVLIFPLPLWLIDVLVAISILFGVSLVLLAIHVPSVLAFSSFPAVLVVTTIFRLALSVAITRQILLQADAGDIIFTFGNTVVGGNLIVGIVIFTIITVVQFIVVAKGAERVAEVAARFTLDGMPGKQLSIDSDLRSGLIDKDEARARRRRLEEESQLHGAMDGAMKFVKGDAIAGIVIIIVNMLAGLAIGMLQLGMSLAEAMMTYTILTIGDGLVAQIPALLSAVSAALIVTRAEGGEKDKNLGDTIVRQVFGETRIIVMGGALALLLMLVPGFPKPVFLCIAALLLGIAFYRERLRFAWYRRWSRRFDQEQAETEELELPDLDAADGENTVELLAPIEDWSSTERALVLRDALRLIESTGRHYGLGLPAPALRCAEGVEQPELRVFDVPLRLTRYVPADFDGEWFKKNAEDQRIKGLSEAAQEALRGALEANLARFLGIQEASDMVNGLSKSQPDLTRELLRLVSPQRLADVLRRLLEERVSLRQLRRVLEAITEAAMTEKEIVPLTERTREKLGDQICAQYASAQAELRVVLAHPELEDFIRQHSEPGTGNVSMNPVRLRGLLDQVRRLEAQRQLEGAVVVCAPDVRHPLRRLLAVDFNALPILSIQELAADLKLNPVAQLALPAGESQRGESQQAALKEEQST
ncbi:MAG: FHIPEP family type III secretion protein [Wenzhouxiangella sp.]